MEVDYESQNILKSGPKGFSLYFQTKRSQEFVKNRKNMHKSTKGNLNYIQCPCA